AKMSFYFGRVNGDILFTTDKTTIEGLIDGKAGPGASKDLTAALAKTPKDAQFSMYFNSKVYSKLFNMVIADIPERDQEEVKSILKLSSGLPEYAAIAAKVNPDYKDYEIYTYQKLPDAMAKSVASAFPSANPHPDVWTRLPKESFAALSLEMDPAKAFDSLTSVLMPIIVPNLIEARKHGNEASAIGSMRTLNNCQALYRERSADQKYGTMKQLAADNLVDSVLAKGLKQGYRFVVTVDPKSPQFEYWISASPVNSSMGDRHFYTDQGGVIRFSMAPISRGNMKQSYVLGRGGPGVNSFAPKIAKKLDEKEIRRLIDEAIAEFNKEFLFGFRLKEDILANLGKSHGLSVISQEKLIPNGVSIDNQERMVAVPAGVLALQVTQTKVYEDLFKEINGEIQREMGAPTMGYNTVERKAMGVLRDMVYSRPAVKRNYKEKVDLNLVFLNGLKARAKTLNSDKNSPYKYEVRVTTKTPGRRYIIKASPRDGYGFHFAISEAKEVRVVQEGFNWDRKVFNNSPRTYSPLPRGFVVKRRNAEKKSLLGFVKTGDYYRMSFPKRDEREINQIVGNGFRPCYTFHNGYLIVTTSEGAMKKALASKKGDCLTESASFNRLMKGQPRTVNSSFVFSIDGVMKQIKANSKLIALNAYPVPTAVTATKRNSTAANKAYAVGSLRTINASQAIFLEREGSQKYGTLKALMASGYIDNVLGSGEKQGYKFIVQLGSNPEYEYWAAADPIAKGGKYLFTNQSGVIYESDSPIRPTSKKSSSPPRNVSPVSGGSSYWQVREAKRKKEREWRKENLDANSKELNEILDSASFLGGFVSTSTIEGNDVESRFLYRLTIE
ncbi:MAG: hypothetical protein P1V97_37380, partial [Planctomycetota bacterium]|nr:hypothetical protein [Planctomycetota bacterium]